MLVSDVFQQAFEDLGVITANETITTALTTDAFTQWNEMLDSLSAEGLEVPNQIMQTFGLSAGVEAYTLGSGGTFATTGGARAMKVTAWRAAYGGVLQNGGKPLSMAEFGAASRQSLGETTSIPKVVGADTSYPLINIRVAPPPSAAPGTLELAYYTPLSNNVTAGDTLALPPGWNSLLEWNLAKHLYSRYPSPSRKDLIWQMAQEKKDAIKLQNAMQSPAPNASAPEGQ